MKRKKAWEGSWRQYFGGRGTAGGSVHGGGVDIRRRRRRDGWSAGSLAGTVLREMVVEEGSKAISFFSHNSYFFLSFLFFFAERLGSGNEELFCSPFGPT
jgi:hypothetical protein